MVLQSSPTPDAHGISTFVSASMSTNLPFARDARHAPLPQLWKAFALCWSVVHVIVLYLLPNFVEPGPRRAGAIAGLLLLAAVYLHLTLRPALALTYAAFQWIDLRRRGQRRWSRIRPPPHGLSRCSSGRCACRRTAR